MNKTHSCGQPWSISSGPGRYVGAIAKSILGVMVPLPDNFTFEYCKKCNVRHMTPELKRRLLAVESAGLAKENEAHP